MANEKENTVTPLRSGLFKLEQHAIQRHVAYVEPDVDILDPSYWHNVQRTIKDGDHITVHAVDNSFFAELVVVGRVHIDLILKEVYRTKTVDESEKVNSQDGLTIGDYELKLLGVKKFCIRSKIDGTIVKEGIPSKSEGIKELEQYTHALQM